jgi:hypothetical protein
MGEALLRYPITGTVGCCARATIGHAAALPRPAMNVRRRIHPSQRCDRIAHQDLGGALSRAQYDEATTIMGLAFWLRD